MKILRKHLLEKDIVKIRFCIFRIPSRTRFVAFICPKDLPTNQFRQQIGGNKSEDVLYFVQERELNNFTFKKAQEFQLKSIS